MVTRALGSVAVAVLMLTTAAVGQTTQKANDPIINGRRLTEWAADLKAPAPETRTNAAYQLSGVGSTAAPAVPALIETLNDPVPVVRYAATVALREIGPAAEAAVPALRKVYEDDINDEIASAARRAIRSIKPGAVPPR